MGDVGESEKDWLHWQNAHSDVSLREGEGVGGEVEAGITLKKHWKHLFAFGKMALTFALSKLTTTQRHLHLGSNHLVYSHLG